MRPLYNESYDMARCRTRYLPHVQAFRQKIMTTFWFIAQRASSLGLDEVYQVHPGTHQKPKSTVPPDKEYLLRF